MINLGASVFSVIANGYSANEAFRNAVNEACYESGNGGYTGTIAEKSEFKIIKCPAGADPHRYAYSLIEDDDDRVCDKWGPAGCIVITEGKPNTIIPTKVKTENFIFKGAREWETWYVLYDGAYKTIAKSKYKDEAVMMAKDRSLKGQIKIDIVLEKRLKGSSPLVATISPVEVKANSVMGKYLFFGWASD